MYIIQAACEGPEVDEIYPVGDAPDDKLSSTTKNKRILLRPLTHDIQQYSNNVSFFDTFVTDIQATKRIDALIWRSCR